MILKLEIKSGISMIEIFLIRRARQIPTPRKSSQLQKLMEEVIILMTSKKYIEDTNLFRLSVKI